MENELRLNACRGSPYEHIPNIFHLIKTTKKNIETYKNTKNPSKLCYGTEGWKRKMDLPYTTVHPNKKVRKTLESIPKKELKERICGEISNKKGIPFFWVMQWKTYLLRIPLWNKTSSDFENTIHEIEETCNSCKENIEGIVKYCIPMRGIH